MDADKIRQTIAGYQDALVADAANPQANYTLDGKTVDRVRWWSFGVRRVEYVVLVVVVSPNDGDAASNLATYTQWRQAIRDQFCRPPLRGLWGVDEVVDVDVLDGSFLNRKELAEGYDYQEVPIKVTTAERVPAARGS